MWGANVREWKSSTIRAVKCTKYLNRTQAANFCRFGHDSETIENEKIENDCRVYWEAVVTVQDKRVLARQVIFRRTPLRSLILSSLLPRLDPLEPFPVHKWMFQWTLFEYTYFQIFKNEMEKKPIKKCLKSLYLSFPNKIRIWRISKKSRLFDVAYDKRIHFSMNRRSWRHINDTFVRPHRTEYSTECCENRFSMGTLLSNAAVVNP